MMSMTIRIEDARRADRELDPIFADIIECNDLHRRHIGLLDLDVARIDADLCAIAVAIQSQARVIESQGRTIESLIAVIDRISGPDGGKGE